MIYKTVFYIILFMLFLINGCSYMDKTEVIEEQITSKESPNIEKEISLESDDFGDSEILGQEKKEGFVDETEAQKIYTDLWIMIQDELVFERNINRKKVQDKIAWFARNQQYIDRVTKRAEPYLFHIVKKLKERDMPLDLALLPIVESAYQPFAQSPSRASGIWQFIPATGKRFGLKQNWWYDGRRDVVAATDAALDYLEALHKRFKGNWFHALAAYNAGEGNVERAIRKNKKIAKKTDFWNLKLPPETRSYVPSLLAIAEVLKNNKKYNVEFKPIKNEPYFEIIDVRGQIDLATVSNLSDLPIDDIYILNPGFNRWATDPNGPHRILLPISRANEFRKKLNKLSKSERIEWKQHVIRKGESLGLIAELHKTSVSTIKEANNLKGNMIREGKSLLIPAAKESKKYYSLSLDARRYKGLKTSDGKRYTYIVRRGDNLWDISRKYGVSVNQLAKWSGISTRSFLKPKQKLIIWVNEEKKYAQNNSVNSTTGNHPDKHVVKKGDSLWLIARELDIHVTDILKWNNLKKGVLIKPGQILKIKTANINITNDIVETNINNKQVANYVVKKGDSLWLIARELDIHVADILKWNNLKKGVLIKPGQILKIKKVSTDV